MKHCFLVFSVFFIAVCSAYAQYESLRSPLSPDEKTMIHRYKLKSMKLYFIGNKGDSLIQMMEYDKAGHLLKTLSDGVMYLYTYNNDGKASAMTDSLKDSAGVEVKDSFMFIYSPNGLLKYARFNDDHSDFTYDLPTLTLVENRHTTSWPEPVISAYTYDSNKNIVEMHCTNAADQSLITEKTSYTHSNKMLHDFITRVYRQYYIDSVVTDYNYNDKDKLYLESTYTSTTSEKNHSYSNSKSIRKDFYDNMGRVTAEYVIENGQETERFEFAYNEYSYEPVSERYYVKGVLKRSDTYTLDDRGLPTSLVETADGYTARYRYKFKTWK